MLGIRSDIEILRSRRSLAVLAGMKKQMITQNRQKSNAKKQKQIKMADGVIVKL